MTVVSTKVRREQSVLVCYSEFPFVCKLLEWLVKSTTPGGKIFGFGYSTYNNSFKLAEQHFRLQVGWTAHSGRAGFATDLIVKGIPWVPSARSKLADGGLVRTAFVATVTWSVLWTRKPRLRQRPVGRSCVVSTKHCQILCTSAGACHWNLCYVRTWGSKRISFFCLRHQSTWARGRKENGEMRNWQSWWAVRRSVQDLQQQWM